MFRGASPTEPFTEAHPSPHHWPGSKIYISQDISEKNKERWLERPLISSHSSFVGAEKSEGQTPFFPDVGCSLPCVFVTFGSQQQYFTRLFLAKLHSHICSWGPHTFWNQDRFCFWEKQIVFFLHWHTSVGVRIGAGMRGVEGNDELCWLHPSINWVHTNKNCAQLCGWGDIWMVVLCIKKNRVLKDQSMEL